MIAFILSLFFSKNIFIDFLKNGHHALNEISKVARTPVRVVGFLLVVFILFFLIFSFNQNTFFLKLTQMKESGQFKCELSRFPWV
mgnify:CR=1 FL=1